MGTTKGQNLRFLLNGKCIAAALSGNIEIDLNIAEISTKDSDNGWQENMPTGHSWKGSVEALVTDGYYDEATLKTDIVYPGSGGEAFYSGRAFTLYPGEVISINSSEAGVGFATLTSPLTPTDPGANTYTNAGTTAITVYALSDTENAEVNVHITDPARTDCAALMAAARTGTPLAVKFSITGGRNNVIEEETLVQGTAIISNLTLTASNRDTSRYTATLTGVGQLSVPEEEE